MAFKSTPAKPSPKVTKSNVSTGLTMPNNIELRNLESWHDDSADKLDDSCYEELADSANTNGWSADEMFKYNEIRHKILSSYSEKTLATKYNTPLPKAKSKLTIRKATKLAKEIEDKVIAEGRVTPESSDDDELFERERAKRTQSRQLKQLEQLLNLKNISNMNLSFGAWQSQLSSNGISNNNKTSTTIHTNFFEPPNTSHNHATDASTSNRSSSQHSNSSATPATASLSSSPTLNDSTLIMKPVTSSSRNILRTCLI